MRHMKFDVQSHPTKDADGVTIVRDEHVDAEGKVTKDVTLGELTKTRGEAGYRATAFVDGERLGLTGLFKTRSQAGHAVRGVAEREERAARKSTKSETKAAAPKAEVLTIEQVAEKLGISRGAALKRAKRGTTVKQVDGGYEIAA